ncbi:Thiol-disulfide isomerase and thioredoxin [Streptococcus pneumoniae]|mgnify:FL=1|nr:thioredoxin domain-containing protein [Streptococcus pneumoniae]EPD20695.1 Thiol-disulfide isomerase and thioredoxin [Streptococcus pneumoniae MNZ14]KXW44860.1 thiol-disulfide isomerase [Streptococcus pneumoniae]KXW53213.1 thiol-disulfide isomerase [Streptococcus pneumoniae]MDG8792921.1 thioredoxin domain-containing protein [Streptococcus pneumoniae]MDG8837954.1 thioredoxin domain-containing protein [Streptococcus pneumoniae]
MNSKKVLILLSLLLIIIVTFTAYLTALSQTDYQIAVNRLQKISIEAVEQKIQHQESFYLYTGRESCPYCQEFAPKLAKAVDKTETTVYYLDSENIDKTSWNNFKTTVGFKTIPNLTYFTNGTVYDILPKASQASVEVIESFIRKE